MRVGSNQWSVNVTFNQRHYTVVRECGRNFKTSRALSPNGLGAFFMVGWNPTFLDVEAPRGLESEITHIDILPALSETLPLAR